MKFLQERAHARLKQLEKLRQDPRYLRVLGRLAREELLFSEGISKSRARPTLEDALWAAEIEPRILELLPAIVLRRPRLFIIAKAPPPDLALVVQELRRGLAITPFRDVSPEKYQYWAAQLGRGQRALAVTKTHRFTIEDIAEIEILKQRWKTTETEVIRRALRLATKT